MTSLNMPTVILGDFNQIEFLDQKLGGTNYIPGASAFSSWRINLMLSELPFHGTKFTWCNNREKGDIIYERLDRGLANDSWRCLFPDAHIINYEILTSDHCAILLQTEAENRRRRRPYKLEAWCLNHEEVEKIIVSRWNTSFLGSSMFVFQRKQQEIRRDCKEWCLKYKKDHGITWDSFREKLMPMQSDPGLGEQVEDELNQRQRCVNIAKDQLVYWKQRTRLKWDLQGDECTSFFFKCVKSRKGRNQIKCLKDMEGVWCHDEDQIASHFFHHFRDLYSPATRSASLSNDASWFETLPRLTREEGEMLVEPFTTEEIREAITSMKPYKSPGQMGSHPYSCKKIGRLSKRICARQ
ncbi:LINE-1 retrotransposable element ORF2 protein [Bienertia sinuspersici]